MVSSRGVGARHICVVQGRKHRQGFSEMWQKLRARIIARFIQWNLNYVPSVEKGTQILLYLKYRDMIGNKSLLPGFGDVEFRTFSQNGEDGILLFVFSLIGTTNKRAVEICAGNGIECNTANLIINHGWQALLFDGDAANVSIGRSFYSRCRDTFLSPPIFVHGWINADNVDSHILGHGFQGEIDLLSLDVDGVDYWIWEAIKCIKPRVVILEYNEKLGFDSVVVAYDPKFDRSKTDMRYWGASLGAYCALGKKKGYRLIGCNHQRLNALFMRSDVGLDIFPEITFESCMQRKPQEYTLLNELSTKFPFVHV